MLGPIEKTLNIVAHADDDLLFLSPDLLHTIQARRPVSTILLTAADAGADADYWQERERGIQAAYAQMCGVANSWIQADAGMIGHPIPVFTLAERSTVSLVFMRLPDGKSDGNGFAATQYQSLQKLWTGSISTIETLDGLSSYSKESLTRTLSAFISSFQPAHIRTQDYIGMYNDGDHSDHHSVAYLVQAAAQRYTRPHSLTGYQGYTTSSHPTNVTGADLTAKQDAFYAYAQHDRAVGGWPDIFPDTWKMNVPLRRLVFLLRSWRSRARYRLKSGASFIYKSTAASADTTFMPWLQRQYVTDSRVSKNHPQPLLPVNSQWGDAHEY